MSTKTLNGVVVDQLIFGCPVRHISNYYLCVITAALLICLNLNNIYAWDLEKNKDGIKVYTRPVAGSPIKEFRGVMIVKSSMAAPIALLDKSKLAPRWIHQCKSLVTLKKLMISKGLIITSPIYRFQLQTVIIRSKVKKNNKTGVVSVTLRS